MGKDGWLSLLVFGPIVVLAVYNGFPYFWAQYGGLVLFLLFIGALGLGIYLVPRTDKAALAEQQRREELKAQYVAKLSVPQLDALEFKHAFLDYFLHELEKAELPLPPRSLMDAMLAAATFLHDYSRAPLLEYTDPIETLHTYGEYDQTRIAAALSTCFITLLKSATFDLEGQFLQRVQDRVKMDVVSALSSPFWADPNLCISKYVLRQYTRTAIQGKMQQRRKKDDRLVWPSEYKGPKLDYLVPELAELFDVLVPFRLSSQSRYAHHWVLGGTMTGKSTLLANMLQYDFEKVKEGKRSVIIIDSKGEKGIARSTAKLPVFAPGGELHGRLIYLQADQHYAINPFILHQKDDRHKARAVNLLTYALSGLFEGAEASSFQEAPLHNFIRLTIELPDASIDHLEKIIVGEKQGKELVFPEEYREYLRRLPAGIQSFFSGQVRPQTRDAILARLSLLRRMTPIDEMLRASENRLNLHSELMRGKVIVIDAASETGDVVQNTTFVRLFIAMLLQATYDRDSIPQSQLKPVFCYLDEAKDFISTDNNFAQMLYQARAQHVGFVVAHQNPGQIESAKVLGGLRDAYIKTQMEYKGMATVSFGEGMDRPKIPIVVPFVDFLNTPKMSAEDWSGILTSMTDQFGATPITRSLSTTRRKHSYDA